jgi:exodeoxyribonuclease VII small subunit
VAKILSASCQPCANLGRAPKAGLNAADLAASHSQDISRRPALRALHANGAGTPKIVVSVQHKPHPPCPSRCRQKIEQPVSYEAALQELEQLIAQIESGQLPLEQMLSGYQRAAELLGFCRSQLEAVQEQVKVLDEGKLSAWTQD